MVLIWPAPIPPRAALTERGTQDGALMALEQIEGNRRQAVLRGLDGALPRGQDTLPGGGLFGVVQKTIQRLTEGALRSA
jgi:hypothetical protein